MLQMLFLHALSSTRHEQQPGQGPGGGGDQAGPVGRREGGKAG